jgi:DNA-binding MarR family transcriptional regulator
LLVLSHLATVGRPVPFTALRDLLGVTDGSLSVHLQKLEEGGLIGLEKRFVARRPQTLIRLTAAGRRAFATYVEELRSIVPGLA